MTLDLSAFRHLTRRHTRLLAVFALFYVLLQGVASAHAVQYGPDSHTHHGEVCLLGHFSQRDDAGDVPSLPALVLPVERAVGVLPAEPAAAPDGHIAIAPHPRGPPSIR